MIETLDDIVERLANQLGIYGTHPAFVDPGYDCDCRLCWTHDLKARILNAVEVERKLS